MTDISKHPLLKQAYDVCHAIEECGASIELTNAVTKASALLMALGKFIDPIAGPFHTLDEDFDHFVACSGFGNEPSEVLAKIKTAYADNWKPHSPLPLAERQVADFLKRPGEDLKAEQPRTLESYFAILSERDVADSIARCTHHKDGAHFYIRPANVDGETLQFVVSGNTLRNV